MPRAWSMIAAVSAGVVALAGCSSSHSPVGGTSTSSAPGPAASSPAGGSTTSSTLFAAGAVPAVAGASDLTKEPTVAPSAGAAPASLTGKDLVVGTGPAAGPDATVTVQYVGALWSGKVFDASWTGQGPATFQLNGVIPGFKDAIIGMKVGGRREIVIPPALGYGSAGQPPAIPGNSTLVFVIDLLRVQ